MAIKGCGSEKNGWSNMFGELLLFILEIRCVSRGALIFEVSQLAMR